jgi:hypothetical protein
MFGNIHRVMANIRLLVGLDTNSDILYKVNRIFFISGMSCTCLTPLSTDARTICAIVPIKEVWVDALKLIILVNIDTLVNGSEESHVLN